MTERCGPSRASLARMMTLTASVPHRRASAFLLLASALPLAAQTTPTAPPPQSRLLYTAEIQGPAAWRAMFAVTNVGTFLGSEAGQAVYQGAVRPFEHGVQQMLGLEDKAYAVARERLLEWSGSLVIEVRAFGATADDVGALMALTGDGRTDLGVLAADLAALAAKMHGGTWTDDAASGGKVLALDGDHVATAPVAIDSDPKHACWVATVTRPAAVAAAKADAKLLAERLAARERKPRPALHVDLDVQVALELAANDEDETFAAALGQKALGHFEFSVGTAGPHAMLEVAQQFHGESRGVLGVLFPDVQGLPRVAALQPEGAAIWKVGYCDVAAIDRMVRDAAKAGGNEDRLDEDLPKAIFDAKEGILAHFTGEYSMFATPTDLEELKGGDFEFGLIFRIRDHEGFAPKWKAARKEIGITELDVETVADHYSLQRLGGFFQLHCMIGPELFAIGYGRDVGDQLKAAATAAREGGWVSKEPTVALPSTLQRFAPKGLNGMAEGDIAMVATQIAWAMEFAVGMGAFGDLPPGITDLDAEALRELLKANRLETARSATGYDAGRWCLRLYW